MVSAHDPPDEKQINLALYCIGEASPLERSTIESDKRKAQQDSYSVIDKQHYLRSIDLVYQAEVRDELTYTMLCAPRQAIGGVVQIRTGWVNLDCLLCMLMRWSD